MNIRTLVTRRLRWALTCMACLTPLASWAEPVLSFVPFSGAGNIAVFDAAAGTGGWVGTVDQFPDPGVTDPLSLVSVVLFTLDAASHTLSGSFVFNTTDLASTLYGSLTGSFLNADILSTGGQFSLDYQIMGGSGQFLGASGFGLSFLDFDPAVAFNNYNEAGLLVYAVPEPSTLWLAGMGLLWVASRRPAALKSAAKSAVKSAMN